MKHDVTTPDGRHVAAADASPVALLLIDLINPLSFPGAEALIARALPMAERIARLKADARRAGIPAIYVNDNFGRWRSDFRTIVAHCLEDGVPGHEVAARLRPEADDYFVLKPKHSGFHATALELLLGHLGVHTLVLTGLAGNVCVLFTANDAYMRDFRVVVPEDAIASNSDEENRFALHQMRAFLHAETPTLADLDLEALRAAPPTAGRRDLSGARRPR